MPFRRTLFAFGIAIVMIAMPGCRTGGTSYQVKWARRGETLAKADKPKDSAKKSPPIQQTAASPDDSAAELEIGDDATTQKSSRWGGLFSRHEKPKRLQLPRTDMIEDEKPTPKDSTFGEF